MKPLFLLCSTFFLILNLLAQNTQEEGTVFFGAGLGKSWSISPTFNIDEATKSKSTLIDDLFAPQWSAKIGYVFANHFALELNAERFAWKYDNPNSFSNDILYARLGIFGMDKIFKTNKSKFAITGLLGLSGGPIFSNNFWQNNLIQFQKNDFNGFGGTATIGLRFEFYKRIFLLLEEKGGVIYQSVKGENFRIDLVQPYIRTNLSLGVFIYERWNESCNTCPKW